MLVAQALTALVLLAAPPPCVETRPPEIGTRSVAPRGERATLHAAPQAGGSQRPAKPEQIGLTDEWKILSRAEPPLMFAVPKKKRFKGLRKRWAIVDLEARKSHELAEIDKAIAAEEKRNPDGDALAALEARKARLNTLWQQRRLMLEVRDHPEQHFEVRITRTTVDKKPRLVAENIRKEFSGNRWSKTKFHIDEEQSPSKSDQKKGRQRYVLDLTSTRAEDGKRFWIRIEIWMLLHGKKGTPYQAMVIQEMPADSRVSKERFKEAQILPRFIRWL